MGFFISRNRTEPVIKNPYWLCPLIAFGNPCRSKVNAGGAGDEASGEAVTKERLEKQGVTARRVDFYANLHGYHGLFDSADRCELHFEEGAQPTTIRTMGHPLPDHLLS